MPSQPPAKSLNHPLRSHPATALVMSNPCFGWDQTVVCFCCFYCCGFVCLCPLVCLFGLFCGGFVCVCLLFFFNLMDVNIILLESLLHCIPVKCACLPQILANFYSSCVRICLPWAGRAATSQPTLLPPTAHFAKVCRGIFSQCGLVDPSLYILQ